MENKVELSPRAEDDLDGMDNAIFEKFAKHLRKMAEMPPRKHLKHGLPFNVDEVGQGRIPYEIRGDTLYVLRCFTDHGEYEKWYRSYKK